MKTQAQEINSLKTQLSSLAKRTGGSIAIRPLSELINKEDFIETNKLTTLFVLVSKANTKKWIQNYESFTDYVVPRSSTRVAEDENSVLYSVVLFKSVVDKFKTKAREFRFIIREMTTQADVEENSEEQIHRLSDELKEMYVGFAQWVLVSFTDVIKNWMHLKILRVFVESVLRYGLSFKFKAYLIMPQKRMSMKKILGILSDAYSNLDLFIGTQSQNGHGKKDWKRETKELRNAGTDKGGSVHDHVYYPFAFCLLPLLMRMSGESKG